MISRHIPQLLTALSATFFAVCAFVFGPAYAQELTTVPGENLVSAEGSNLLLQEGGLNGPSASSQGGVGLQSAADVDGLYRELEAAIEGWDGKSRTMKVDIAKYNIPEDDYWTYHVRLLNSHGEYFYVDDNAEWMPDGQHVAEVVLYFKAGQYKLADISAFEKKVLLAIAGVNSRWSDEQKALYLHDYLCTHCRYDHTLKKHDAYNALVEGSAVCQGYSLAYDYLLSRVGVDCDIVTSNTLNHAWNLVTVAGKKYHVDCTFDDPAMQDVPSRVTHTHFLRSRSGNVSADHNSTDWVNTAGKNIYSSNPATSTTYDTYYWSNCETVIPNVGNLWAYTTYRNYKAAVYVHDYARGTDTELFAIGEAWPELGNGGSSWGGNYASLSATAEVFVVAGPTKVWLVSPNGQATAARTLTAAEQAKGRLYSLLYNEATGRYDCAYYVSPMSASPAGTFSLNLGSSRAEVEAKAKAELQAKTKAAAWKVGAKHTLGSGATRAQYQVTAKGKVAYLKAYTGKSKKIVVPATVKIEGKTFKVVSIGANAAKGNKYVTSVAIGKNVTSIGKGAFSACAKLASVTGGANVATIGDAAYKDCKALKSYTFGAKVKKVGAKAFNGAKKLAKLSFKGKNLKTVGAGAFKGGPAKPKVGAPKAKKAAYKKLLEKGGLSKKAIYS